MSTCLAPAVSAESRTARRSTSVMPDGTQTMTLGFTRKTCLSMIVLRKYRSIFSVTSKSAMTPSFSGRTARMPSGVRPEHALGLEPDALDLAGGFLDRDDGGLVQHDALRPSRRRGCWPCRGPPRFRSRAARTSDSELGTSSGRPFGAWLNKVNGPSVIGKRRRAKTGALPSTCCRTRLTPRVVVGQRVHRRGSSPSRPARRPAGRSASRASPRTARRRD